MVLGIVNIGDVFIDLVKKVGDIFLVLSVDYEIIGLYLFYGKICVVVRG